MKITFPIIIALSVVLGAGGGVGLRFLSGAGVKPAHAEPETGDTPHAAAISYPEKAEKAAARGDHKKDKKANKGYGAKPEQATYFKFSRQFVAPIVAGGEPKAMMILDVMIELAPDASEALYADEPKLRDAVLKALLAQSANGDLPEMLTKPEMLEKTRTAVLDSVRQVIGDDARSVLLMDVGYQPF